MATDIPYVPPDHTGVRTLLTTLEEARTAKKKDANFAVRRGQYEIVVRGYDKFFNVGEVQATKWDYMATHTKPPYELTLKENGCIIFVSGLEDDTLLVCSKNSTGKRVEEDTSHAIAGQERIEKQLAVLGRTGTNLARELRLRNATAVIELCDDSFEEHVLAYGPEEAGLYLHGINLNLPSFATYSSAAVQSFAEEWGFRKTGVVVMHDLQEARRFLDEAAETGAHDGRSVEGFVVRCKMSKTPGVAPYVDWFFKYKFEEPYLMYHPGLAARYNKNHGIIGLRDDFLKHKHLKGLEAANMDRSTSQCENAEELSEISQDVVLCPIATIGCGKTTLARALTHLFGWGHIQNDNITGPKRPPRFNKYILDELKHYKVAFADRNNTGASERHQLISDFNMLRPTAKLVGLHYRHDAENMDKIARLTRERVLKRGDNHQTIRAATDSKKFLDIMKNFIDRFEPCNPDTEPDNGFDLVIELDPTANTRVNLEKTVTELHRFFPRLVKNMPSPEKLDEAITVALAYRPNIKTGVPGQNKSSTDKPIEYISVQIPANRVTATLERAFGRADAQTSRFYNELKQSRRVQPKFHVTLMHRASEKQNPALWQNYKNLVEEADGAGLQLGSCNVMLERVVYDNRIMAIVVRIIDDNGKWQCFNRVAHITVGTRDSSVKPKESNDLLTKWLEHGTENGQISEVVFSPKPILDGQVKAVLSR
ncbi:hypothetical protein CDD81_8066 [Ophiocordyceps australis]|uniref:tRNA ligase n=1 Tax=Ophiocordyceps australis TaxID=1399860 RepID=A0A2C5XWL6_9HYPO|nr:hypothetical protein CDD81_8066 [Ophiocordyceps australis]